MNKIFEDYFSELQADIIDICLEYVEDMADYIFVILMSEKNLSSYDFFYQINKITIRRSKINYALSKNSQFKYDTSDDRQLQTMDIVSDNFRKIRKLFKDYSRPLPTQIKLIYNVHSNKFSADYDYNIHFSNIDGKSTEDCADEWFEEIKNANKNPENIAYYKALAEEEERKRIAESDPDISVILQSHIFKDFILNEKPAAEFIEKYKGKVSDKIIRIWETYGFGDILDGLIKIVNPEKYAHLLEYSVPGFKADIVLFATAMGDLIFWNENQYTLIADYRRGGIDAVKRNTFFKRLIENKDNFYQDNLFYEPFPEALEKFGRLAFDECYAHKKPLRKKGKANFKNIQVMKIADYIKKTTDEFGAIDRYLGFSMNVSSNRK